MPLHMGCMVVLTQSLHSYYMSMKGDVGKHQADGLLTNFATKVFHALGDVQTAEWASGLIGKGRGVCGHVAVAGEDLYAEFMGHQISTNSSGITSHAQAQPADERVSPLAAGPTA